MTGPNVLILMVDQPNGALFLDGPADWLHAPNLRALAARSRRFRNCYAASPLCAPARASFMSGLLPSRTRVYDNAAEFAPDIPTYAHHLRRAGWQACLSGKMHFVGPDQLHGFEERLTTDIYPADFGWTPDYREPGERIDWWYHNMGSVTGSGVAEITNQMEYDDEVCHHARMRLRDHGRGHDPRPWCLTVSFTHPHAPYVARHESWDLYADCGHLTPQVPQMPPEDHGPHSKRILDANDRGDFDVTKEDVRRSRRAYFATISHPDAKVGEILKVLDDTRQEAVILFVSDHGDMLGERGLWYKMSFLEGSARVPMMICAPGMEQGPDLTPESNIDVCPTLCDLAGVDTSEVAPWTTGRKPRAPGAGRGAGYAGGDGIRGRRRLRAAGRAAAGAAEIHPLRPRPRTAVRPPRRPARTDEPFGRSATSRHAGAIPRQGRHQVEPCTLRRDVRESQVRRCVAYEALRQGGHYPWDWQPMRVASERSMRNRMDLNVPEESQRFPRGK